MMEQLKICFSRPDYLFTAIGNACTMLFLFLYLTVYGIMLEPYGYTDESFISNVGVATQTVGIISGVAGSIVLIMKPNWLAPASFLVAFAALGGVVFFDLASTT